MAMIYNFSPEAAAHICMVFSWIGPPLVLAFVLITVAYVWDMVERL